MMFGVRRATGRLAFLFGLFLAACAAEDPSSAATGPDDLHFAGLGAAERGRAEAALQEALETRTSGATAHWIGAGGSAGSVTPLRTFRIVTGHYCRDFLETVVAAGETRNRRATACRDETGIWRRVEPQAS